MLSVYKYIKLLLLVALLSGLAVYSQSEDKPLPETKAAGSITFIQNFYTNLVTVETTEKVGAATMKFLGSLTPTLLQPQMLMDYQQPDDTTRVLLYSLSNEYFTEGNLISFTGPGTLVAVEASDSSGAMLDGSISVITDVADDEEGNLPESITLSQNYPNPFNSGTYIALGLDKAYDLVLEVINIKGQLVRTLQDGRLTAGSHYFYWDGRNREGDVVASGLYFFRVRTDQFSLSRKMILLK